MHCHTGMPCRRQDMTPNPVTIFERHWHTQLTILMSSVIAHFTIKFMNDDITIADTVHSLSWEINSKLLRVRFHETNFIAAITKRFAVYNRFYSFSIVRFRKRG